MKGGCQAVLVSRLSLCHQGKLPERGGTPWERAQIWGGSQDLWFSARWSNIPQLRSWAVRLSGMSPHWLRSLGLKVPVLHEGLNRLSLFSANTQPPCSQSVEPEGESVACVSLSRASWVALPVFTESPWASASCYTPRWKALKVDSTHHMHV